MPGICPLCGATLNPGVKFCVVCGRRSASEESSKMGAIKSGVRHADMTRHIDSEDVEDIVRKGRKPLRFRQVRSLWVQILYIVVGVALFFCAVRFVLEKMLPPHMQRTVHSFIKESPVSKISLPRPPVIKDKPKPPAPGKKKKSTKKTKRSR